MEQINENKLNIVAQDNIWIDVCTKEKMYAKAYNDKYGFLSGPIEKFAEGQLHEIVDIDRPKREAICPNLLEHAGLRQTEGAIPIPKFPMTTSSEIGLRSDSKYALDKYKTKNLGKTSLLKQFNWPSDACS